MTNERPYIPALGRDVLTPIYDLGIRLTLPERRFKLRVIESAHLEPGMRVVDVGCGTGTLLLIAAEVMPEARLFGVDIDDRILERARQKLSLRDLNIQLEQASATDLPYADGSFERVLSTLTFHHLTRQQKQRAFAEAYRVLRPSGELHVGDFGAPHTRYARAASYLIERIGREHVQENFLGLLPQMALDVGFSSIEETGRFGTIFGVLRSFRAAKTLSLN